MKITADEFCASLSARDKRVELIGGFHFWLKNSKGVRKATESEFQDLFTEYTRVLV